MASKARIRWVFDGLPPSGARRGGDPSEYAFRRDLESLVREVVQNANDQSVAWPRVGFRLRELSGDELEEYLNALSWSSLGAHLRGAAATKGGAQLRESIDQLERDGRLLLLNVEDRNTIGLTGDESEGESHFRALCKDTLYSHKASESAGGSYGLGKSVLWAFSGLSTVLFCSELMDPAPGQVSPRVIGRAELPSHAVRDGAWFTGSGWLGRAIDVEGRGERAESVWADEACALAERLHLARTPDQPGTTIQIVGFRDPTNEDERPERVATAIEETSVRFFWPAMVARHRQLRVWVELGDQTTHIDVAARAEIAPFVACYEARSSPASELDRPGDVAVRTIPLDIPAHRDGTRATTGQVDLVVRLAAEHERSHRLIDHVALFRAPGMVVRYWDRRGLLIGMRPFHAIVIAGEARAPQDPSPGDRETERFLRAAEPPGHDEWRATPALRQQYKRGWRVALDRLHRRITEELKLLLAPRVTQGKKGPDRLQRRFPIGPRGGRGGGPSAFRFSGLSARYADSRWTFSGVVEPKRKSRTWHAQVELRELGADGSALDRIAIEELTLEDPDAAQLRIEGGAARILATSGVRSIAFSGRSVASSGRAPPGELSFEVVGVLEDR